MKLMHLFVIINQIQIQTNHNSMLEVNVYSVVAEDEL